MTVPATAPACVRPQARAFWSGVQSSRSACGATAPDDTQTPMSRL